MEQSPDRYKTLVSQLTRAGSLKKDTPGTVTAFQCDFTKQDVGKYSDVTHMLVDPSCSGSGILSRLDYLINEESQDNEESKEKEQERLRSLSSFQSSMIDHAMHFPSLCRLVYSTCSIHQEENESAVMKALESTVAKTRGWKLVPRNQVIPSWSTRAITEYCNGQADAADSMIRCNPGGAQAQASGEDVEAGVIDLDATNGFFLACFERTSNNSAKNKKRNIRAREKAKEEKRQRVEKD